MLNKKKNDSNKSKRNVALDIIRITALFSVISVHFFKNNGFYAQPIVGERMYVATVCRTAFMVCVPLFIVLTGYLMNRKTLKRSYCKGIRKTLDVYIFASLACAAYKNIFLDKGLSAIDIVLGILNFSLANYSWYVEMYLGLYLLIPFLNIIYHNLNSKREKQFLVLTCLILTSFPSVLNIYNWFLDDWWLSPTISNTYNKIMPSWWTSIYPLTYYFIGCYLSEFKIKLKQVTNAFLLVLCVILFGSFNYYRSYGGVFIWGEYQGWGALPNVVMTFLLFNLLLNMNFDYLSENAKRVLNKISNWCFGGYLVSWIFDSAFYPKLNTAVAEMPLRLEYYIVIVPIVFVCSIALSAVLTEACNKVLKVMK